MPRPTRFGRRSQSDTSGQRSCGRRVAPDQGALDVHHAVQRVIVEGHSVPFTSHVEHAVLPMASSLAKMYVPRDGQINELSIHVGLITDGPAYLRVVDVATNQIIARGQFKSADVMTVDSFDVSKGQRLDFVITNLPPADTQPAKVKAMTGSASVSLTDIWISFMYFAKGGNDGPGQASTRLLVSGPAKLG